MFCHGIDAAGDPDSRNDIAVVVQQTDNSALGAEGFVPSHSDYDDAKVIKGRIEEIWFSVFIFRNVPDISDETDSTELATILLSNKERAFFAIHSAYGIRFGDANFEVNWTDHELGNGTVRYEHSSLGKSHTIGSKFEGGFFYSLHCEEPYRVDVPGIASE